MSDVWETFDLADDVVPEIADEAAVKRRKTFDERRAERSSSSFRGRRGRQHRALPSHSDDNDRSPRVSTC